MVKKHKLIIETAQFAHENIYRSWYYLSSTLLLTIIAFWGTGWFDLGIERLLSGLLAGLLTCRLFVIYHDFRHEAILRKSGIAKFIMNIFGILVLAPASIWDETHDHHHHHNSKFSTVVIGSFPTITSEVYKGYGPSRKNWYHLLRHPLIILFAYIPVFLISFCLWPFVENPRKYYDCGIAVLVHGMIGTILYLTGGWPTVFYTLLIPCFTMFAMGGYIFYAQHNFPSVMLRSDAEWDYFDAALLSSSYIKMNGIMRWFTANIGYHHVHHVNSRIPFYRLPEAMNKIPELQNPRCTSLHPMEIWKCIQLKLWDEKSGKMISLTEFKKLYSHHLDFNKSQHLKSRVGAVEYRRENVVGEENSN